LLAKDERFEALVEESSRKFFDAQPQMTATNMPPPYMTCGQALQ